MYSASPEALPKAKIGKFEYLTTYEKHMLFTQQKLYQQWFAGGITGPAAAAGLAREAAHYFPLFEEPCPDTFEIAIYKSLLASANFVDFATVDDGASAHDAHLDAALADFDDEFTALQIQSGRLDGKRPAEGGAEGRD